MSHLLFFFIKQKTAYERRISDWSSDVCSSDLADDEIVEAIREGGLIDIGKTTVPEFGAACYTEPEVAPPARSPFDRTRSAAGSSGGAAAAELGRASCRARVCQYV